jgi:hypothetical protein
MTRDVCTCDATYRTGAATLVLDPATEMHGVAGLHCWICRRSRQYMSMQRAGRRGAGQLPPWLRTRWTGQEQYTPKQAGQSWPLALILLSLLLIRR